MISSTRQSISGKALLFAGAFFLLVAQPAVGQVETFTVTTAQKTSEHPYFEEGFSVGFAIDGTEGKELILEKGEDYVFQMDGVESFHPFYLTTSAIGVGGEPYNDGVSGNGASGDDQLTFTPPLNAPDTLWYQCQNHRKMGWRMAMVVDSAQASVDADEAVSFDDTGVTVGFSGTSGSGTVLVSKFNSAPSSQEGISESNVSAYRFAVSAGGDLSFDSNTEIRFDVGTLSGIGDASNVTVYRRSSVGAGAFTALSTTYDADENELVAPTGEAGEFVFASDSEPLPVELAAFDGQSDRQTVKLTWRTASETNNAGFRVLRKGTQEQGGAWIQVGFVEGAGTTTEPRSYRFTDADVPYAAETLSYRLKQVDTDGTTHLSDVVIVERSGPEQIELRAPFPNPARSQTTVRYALPQRETVTVRVYDVLGRRMMTLEQGAIGRGREQLQLDVSDLPSGTYLLHLQAGEEVRSQRLTVVR